MKYTEGAQALLERYLWEVEKRLPFAKRRDIIRETASALLDMTEQQAQEEPVTEETVHQVLTEFGSPRQIARGYARHHALIPEPYFSVFKLVSAIVAAVLVAFSLFSFVLADQSSLLETLGGLWGGLTSALGQIVIIFFIIQHLIPDDTLEDESQEDWDPNQLPILEYQKPLSRAESVFSIIMFSLLILLVTVFRERLVFCFLGDLCPRTTFLGPAFIALIPMLVLRWTLAVIFYLVMLINRGWSEMLRISDLAFGLWDILIISLFLRGSPDRFIRFDFLELSEEFAPLAQVLRWVYTGIVLLILVGTVYEVVRKIRRIIVRPAAPLDIGS